jgi:alpha,alpha-trehalase
MTRQLLQTVNIEALYDGPKTFVDKPTDKSSQDVLADFAALNMSSVTEGEIINFVDADFKDERMSVVWYFGMCWTSKTPRSPAHPKF